MSIRSLLKESWKKMDSMTRVPFCVVFNFSYLSGQRFNLLSSISQRRFSRLPPQAGNHLSITSASSHAAEGAAAFRVRRHELADGRSTSVSIFFKLDKSKSWSEMGPADETQNRVQPVCQKRWCSIPGHFHSSCRRRRHVPGRRRCPCSRTSCTSWWINLLSKLTLNV